ncbi:MAG: hypothetical protein M1832_005513 [Thelocarpon impressellum]|nr:MAG: hypothetical protein M1832_005513 [Thelocarpon impressellum]
MYQSIGRSEKLPDVNFGDADLQVVQYVKQEIIASTTNKDLLLFLGNTGAYFYYSFKPEDDRNVHLIPLSGSCMERSYTESAPVAKYKAHILDPAFKPGRFDRLVLIDYMYSGKGLLQFTMLLSSLGFLHRKYVKDMNPYLINLAYPPDDVFPGIARAARYKTNIIEAQVKVLKEVVIGQDRATLHKFIEGNFGRILPSYPRSVWQYPLHEVPNADREVGESIVRQIMANRVGS